MRKKTQNLKNSKIKDCHMSAFGLVVLKMLSFQTSEWSIWV